MDKNCKERTISVSLFGTYKFEMIPCRIINAPATFQRMIDEVPSGLPFAMVGVDDFVSFSDTWEEHVEHCMQVFKRIKQEIRKPMVTNCSFAQSEVRLLGHVVNYTGVKVDTDRINGILEALTPSSVTDLVIFLRFAGYYRRKIRNFVDSSAILHSATAVKKEFGWATGMQEDFGILKEKLTTLPVLVFPDFDSPFVVETDNSSSALRVVLSQNKDG